ncbi:MAG: dienelactone hydrolase [Planctomycetota bacterium]|jgi:dienelactone hydrolase
MLLGLTALVSAALLATAHPSDNLPLPQAYATPAPMSAVVDPPAVAPATAPATGQKAKGSSEKSKADEEAGLPVRLKTADKKELAARYFAPKKSKKKLPGVLIVHDKGSDSKDLTTLAEALAKKDMGVLLLELRGHGDNATENYDWAKADEKQRKSMWAFASKDLEAAALFLGKRKELHHSKLIVVGHGGGCSLAATHAIEDRNTLAVVLIQPAESVYDFKLKDALIDMDGIPTLILCGKQSFKKMVKAKEASGPKNPEKSSVVVSSLKSKPKEVLEDDRLSKYMTAWLAEHI